MFVVYNVGLTDHVIRDRFVKLNDNRYHVIRFNRLKANATLQLDDNPVQMLNPTGKSLLRYIWQVTLGGV